jgi:hypothetical protein
MLKSVLKLAAVFAIVVVASPSQEASASHCAQLDPWLFCDCARWEAQQCALDFELCGGFYVEGCSEALTQCRLESGIDMCE